MGKSILQLFLVLIFFSCGKECPTGELDNQALYFSYQGSKSELLNWFMKLNFESNKVEGRLIRDGVGNDLRGKINSDCNLELKVFSPDTSIIELVEGAISKRKSDNKWIFKGKHSKPDENRSGAIEITFLPSNEALFREQEVSTNEQQSRRKKSGISKKKPVKKGIIEKGMDILKKVEKEITDTKSSPPPSKPKPNLPPKKKILTGEALKETGL